MVRRWESFWSLPNISLNLCKNTDYFLGTQNCRVVTRTSDNTCVGWWGAKNSGDTASGRWNRSQTTSSKLHSGCWSRLCWDEPEPSTSLICLSSSACACREITWHALPWPLMGYSFARCLEPQWECARLVRHQIRSCIWDNANDLVRSFRAPFVLSVIFFK